MVDYFIYETQNVTHFFKFSAPEGLTDAEVLEKWNTFCDDNNRWDCYVDEDYGDIVEVEVERA